MGPGVSPWRLSCVLRPFCFPRWILFLKLWGSGQGWCLNKQTHRLSDHTERVHLWLRAWTRRGPHVGLHPTASSLQEHAG